MLYRTQAQFRRGAEIKSLQKKNAIVSSQQMKSKADFQRFSKIYSKLLLHYKN